MDRLRLIFRGSVRAANIEDRGETGIGAGAPAGSPVVQVDADWAGSVAAAVRVQCGQRPGLVLERVDVVSPEVVEVIYRWPEDVIRRGLRLSLNDVEQSERMRGSTPGEVAFDLVRIGMQEPRPVEELSSPDAAGVHWLPASAWIDG